MTVVKKRHHLYQGELQWAALLHGSPESVNVLPGLFTRGLCPAKDQATCLPLSHRGWQCSRAPSASEHPEEPPGLWMRAALLTFG